MPMGKGTYGSQVGRPKKAAAKKAPAKKKMPAKRKPATGNYSRGY
tara:strand:+ start:2033 stop:2167 length:135 start_codon:yes stop_codon:yes gene_type:complete